MTRFTRGLRSCESPHITRTGKTGNAQQPFVVKLAPEFFDARIIICITFSDKFGEGSKQVTDFKIRLRMGY
jgi:hypothetical protein